MNKERGGGTETGRRGDREMMMNVLKLALTVVMLAAAVALCRRRA